jgi:hypothetical protein
MTAKKRSALELKLAKVEWVVAGLYAVGRVPSARLLALATELRLRLS